MLNAATTATIVPYMCTQEAFFLVDRSAEKLAAERIHWLANNSIGCREKSLFATETMNDCSDSTVLSRLTVLTWPASSLVFLSAFQKRMCLLYKACGTKWAYPLWRRVWGPVFPPNSSWSNAVAVIPERARTPYMGTSLIRNSPPLGPYSSPMPRALWWSQGVGAFL